MYCPRCGGQMQIQAVSEIKKRGCLTVLLYIFLLCVPIAGWIALFMLLRGRKSKTVNYAVCQKCGYRTSPKNALTVPPRKEPQVTPSAPKKIEEKKKELDVIIPKKVDDCILLYYYPKIKIAPCENALEIAKVMQKENRWGLTPSVSEDGVDLLFDDTRFATLIDRVDMVKDWIKRGDPLLVYLGNIGDSGNYAIFAFYRDEEKRLSYRESSVVKLTRYKNEDAQMNMSGLEAGEKLELEEDYEREDGVNVLADGAEIGSLPKKYATKYIEEGCAGVFVDHIDSDEEFNDVPFVKIYW